MASSWSRFKVQMILGLLWRLDSALDRFVPVGNLRGPLPKLNYHLWNIAFSPDSKRVAIAAHDDPTPYLWFLTMNAEELVGVPLRTGDRDFKQMAFSKDGSMLFVLNSTSAFHGGQKNRGSQIYTFNVQSQGKEVVGFQAFSSHEEDVNNFQVIQEPHMILVPGKRLDAWPIQNSNLMLARLRTIGRNMTWDEWVQSGQSGPYHKTFEDVPVHPTVLNELARRLAAGDTIPAGVSSSQAVRWAIESDMPAILNEIAWELGMQGLGDLSLEAVTAALKHVPNTSNYRDTRGVARALIGDKKGAIEDFQFFIDSQQKDNNAQAIEQRKQWITELTAGRTPFTAEKE
jgi:hypothetical protein